VKQKKGEEMAKACLLKQKEKRQQGKEERRGNRKREGQEVGGVRSEERD